MGTCRSELLDHLLIFSARHLEEVIKEFLVHYHQARRTRASNNAAQTLGWPSSHCLWVAGSSAMIAREVYCTSTAERRDRVDRAWYTAQVDDVRIRGELLKVGYRVSATAIRNLLRREKLGPGPTRFGLGWKAFLRAQASAIVVSDFFAVDTVFLRRLYVLLYMELATRRIVLFAVTDRPDAGWVAQQSRNLVWKVEGSPIRVVIHDHDAKLAGSADAVFRAEGG